MNGLKGHLFGVFKVRPYASAPKKNPRDEIPRRIFQANGSFPFFGGDAWFDA